MSKDEDDRVAQLQKALECLDVRLQREMARCSALEGKLSAACCRDADILEWCDELEESMRRLYEASALPSEAEAHHVAIGFGRMEMESVRMWKRVSCRRLEDAERSKELGEDA